MDINILTVMTMTMTMMMMMVIKCNIRLSWTHDTPPRLLDYISVLYILRNLGQVSRYLGRWVSDYQVGILGGHHETVMSGPRGIS